MSLDIIIDKKEIRSVYGGQDFFIIGIVKHKLRGVLNTYKVSAKVAFIDGFNIELNFNDVIELLNDTNSETLVDEAILQRCNDEKY